MVQLFDAMPEQEGTPDVPETDKQRIMHASMPVGTNTLMLSDSLSEHDDDSASMRVAVSTSSASREEADRIFAMLSKNGMVVMPMMDQFWGDYFGICHDPYGIQWMVNFTPS